jgi:argininosuccinate lyase
MKLWEKDYQLDQLVETFMTGDDPLLDQALVVYDCLGSIAHAKMLKKIGIVTSDECTKITNALADIIREDEAGVYSISAEDEDVHTAVENTLVNRLGDIGKKLHTARSRNDQVLLDVRLYSRDCIRAVVMEVLHACRVLCDFAEKYALVPIPGRTHFQRAMPSSLGLWAGAFAESFLDDVELLKASYWLIDQCPLGSAASYGVSLPIDRQLCSDLLGFRTVQNNVLYANNSRGKFESSILSSLAQVMNDLSKVCTDIIVFSAPEFGYIGLPEKFCPGSSLMPQKRNPCPLELIRAKSATVQGMLFQVLEITRGLPSGYNRDLQETKRPLMHGFEVTLRSLQVFSQIFSQLNVQTEKCVQAFSPELFATDRVLKLVQQGVPFRDAYQEVAKNPDQVLVEDPIANIASKTHLGATGNLGIKGNIQRIQEYQRWAEASMKGWTGCKRDLLTCEV